MTKTKALEVLDGMSKEQIALVADLLEIGDPFDIGVVVIAKDSQNRPELYATNLNGEGKGLNKR